jgi:hypothetical protein
MKTSFYCFDIFDIFDKRKAFDDKVSLNYLMNNFY